jgi:hypothetical protein
MDDARYQKVLSLAGQIGLLLEEEYPRLVQVDRSGGPDWDPEDGDELGGDPMGTWLPRTTEGVEDIGNGLVNKEYVAAVAEGITSVISEILQAWLDAGSEREATDEEMGPVIESWVRGWSDAAPVQLESGTSGTSEGEKEKEVGG